jgi:hypothetical protein
MTRITSFPEEGDESPWNHIRAQLVTCEDQSMLAPILTTPGLLPGPDVWCRSLFHSTSLRTFSLAWQPPSVIWKETLGPLQATGLGSGDLLPNRAWQSNLSGASKMLQEQYRKYDWPVGIRLTPRWLEERKIYYASRPAPGHLQNGAASKLGVIEVFILRKTAANKQGVQKQTWQLAVQGYNRSCQHRMKTTHSF